MTCGVPQTAATVGSTLNQTNTQTQTGQLQGNHLPHIFSCLVIFGKVVQVLKLQPNLGSTGPEEPLFQRLEPLKPGLLSVTDGATTGDSQARRVHGVPPLEGRQGEALQRLRLEDRVPGWSDAS